MTALANGRDVDRTLERHRIDLIVLDLMLPGEDGLSVCKRLRAASHVPIIMLTAKGDEIDRIRRAGNRCRRLHRQAVQSARIAGAHPRCAAPSGQPRSTRRRTARAYSVFSAGGSTASCANCAIPTARACRHRCRIRPVAGLLRAAGPHSVARSIARCNTRPQRRRVRTQHRYSCQRLRRKIEPDPHHPAIIKTVRAGGYVFTPDVMPA